jgi:hypothetical protein
MLPVKSGEVRAHFMEGYRRMPDLRSPNQAADGRFALARPSKGTDGHPVRRIFGKCLHLKWFTLLVFPTRANVVSEDNDARLLTYFV